MSAAPIGIVLLQSSGGRAGGWKESPSGAGPTRGPVPGPNFGLGGGRRGELSSPPLIPSGMVFVLPGVCCADAHTVPESPPCISLFQHISLLQN